MQPLLANDLHPVAFAPCKFYANLGRIADLHKDAISTVGRSRLIDCCYQQGMHLSLRCGHASLICEYILSWIITLDSLRLSQIPLYCHALRIGPLDVYTDGYNYLSSMRKGTVASYLPQQRIRGPLPGCPLAFLVASVESHHGRPAWLHF